jgi:SP family general alpha glucoside:H+ symporter-like MFS transporter
MSSGDHPKNETIHVDNVDHVMQEKNVGHPQVLSEKDIMENAFEAENREHDMGLWEAVKDHPVACFWAFIFCFTIVSLGPFC